MIFTRIVYCALVVGILTGSLLSLMQVVAVDPIIFAAEDFETGEPSDGGTGHRHDGPAGHGHGTWEPEAGAERTFYTVVSNIFAAAGFAAVLLALMSQFRSTDRQGIRLYQGLLWGLAGFAAIYLAPGVGLPPEIPGIQAPPIEDRQLWWLLAVSCVAVGIGVLALARAWFKVLGAVFVAIPYVVGPPAHEGSAFVHAEPGAVSRLADLHTQFIMTSGAVNLAFWIVLGFVSAYTYNRWLRLPG